MEIRVREMGFAILMNARVLWLPLAGAACKRWKENNNPQIVGLIARDKSDREKFPCRRCCQSANPMHRDIKIIVVDNGFWALDDAWSSKVPSNSKVSPESIPNSWIVFSFFSLQKIQWIKTNTEAIASSRSDHWRQTVKVRNIFILSHAHASKEYIQKITFADLHWTCTFHLPRLDSTDENTFLPPFRPVLN